MLHNFFHCIPVTMLSKSVTKSGWCEWEATDASLEDATKRREMIEDRTDQLFLPQESSLRPNLTLPIAWIQMRCPSGCVKACAFHNAGGDFLGFASKKSIGVIYSPASRNLVSRPSMRSIHEKTLSWIVRLKTLTCSSSINEYKRSLATVSGPGDHHSILIAR
jgi:hypothetical protein